MSTPAERQAFIDALEAQNLERERLFLLLSSLGNCLDREMVIDTMSSLLGVVPVETEDSATFDDVTVRFSPEGRLASLSRIIDGS